MSSRYTPVPTQEDSNEKEDNSVVSYIVSFVFLVICITTIFVIASLSTTEVSPCDDKPCMNGASCKDIDSETFDCTCATGWEGPTCEINKNDCATNPCKNNGVCADALNDFTCSCQAGFTGKTCDGVIGTTIEQDIVITGLTAADVLNNPEVREGIEAGVAASLAVDPGNVEVTEVTNTGTRRRLLQAGIDVKYNLNLPEDTSTEDIDNFKQNMEDFSAKADVQTTLLNNIKEKVEEKVLENPILARKARTLTVKPKPNSLFLQNDF